MKPNSHTITLPIGTLTTAPHPRPRIWRVVLDRPAACRARLALVGIAVEAGAP
jgi:hypothetical protein